MCISNETVIGAYASERLTGNDTKVEVILKT